MCVTGGSQDLENTVINGKKGNIEGSTTKIVDDDLSFSALFVETVSDGSSRWFIDDAEDLKTGNNTSILGGLALSVIEVLQKVSIIQNRQQRK
jgi:hypothetical protein